MAAYHNCSVAFCLLISGLFQASLGLQWTSDASLGDNSTLPACAGEDVALPWDYTKDSAEHEVDIEWRYQPDTQTAEKVLATQVNGHFFADPSDIQRLEYVPGAGIRLLEVSDAYTGTYSVHVNLNLHGSIVTHSHAVNVVVTETSVSTNNGALHATLQGAQYLPTTQQHHLILTCGDFDPLWMPGVSVVWTTPMGQTLPSTFNANGQFSLAVPNPFVSGDYSCNVDNSAPAMVCVSSDSPLRRGATVSVDGVGGRVMLINSEMSSMQQQVASMAAQIQTLQNNNTQMTQQLQVLESGKSQMAAELQRLRGENANLTQQIQTLTQPDNIRLMGGNTAYEGRVEVRQDGGHWGTVCDDNWTAKEATVVCRQLGMPHLRPIAYESAHFGSGSGSILLDEVVCSGTETKLFDCRNAGIGHSDCTHSEDAGVRCQ